MSEPSRDAPSCPLPHGYDRIVMAHGGGGRLMQQLLQKLVLPAFDNDWLRAQHDSAELELGPSRLAFTTDSYVVQPLFFPGGDIGTLAVCGTLNDLAMAGARPLFLSCALVLEEGLSTHDLQRVLASMSETARRAEVAIVTGDTKVVDKGRGDGLYINTSGIGLIEHRGVIAPSSVRPGDVVIVNGDIGRHGMAIMAEREGLRFDHSIDSDCADLSGLVRSLVDTGIELHCLRDLTRGGLASALIEIAEAAGLGIALDEVSVPLREDVAAACELLGFDPFYVANEGRFVALVPAARAEAALECMQRHPLGRGAAVIGRVGQDNPGILVLNNRLGLRRVLERLTGEQLPRIC